MARSYGFTFSVGLFLALLFLLFGMTGETAAQVEDPPAMGIGSAIQPAGTLPGDPQIELVLVAEGLVDPVNVAAPNDGSGRIFIVERVGTIRIVENEQLLDEPFLDISSDMKIDFLEQGLLGLAFHPDYEENGRFFVNYTDYRTSGDTFIVEFTVSDDDPNQADPDSARVLLTFDQPFVNHNGGTMRFGPDGYLYIASGDGGMAGDPYRNAQNLNTLLGALLRIDVDVNAEEQGGYGIPDDNPFVGQVLFSSEANQMAQDGSYVPNARPEIWAYGLRNPWQFSFDSQTGDLYIADVGQREWEEINFQPAGSEGGQHYGWPMLEGSHCYPPDSDCYPFGELPVAEYQNTTGVGCSITGIGVYRGEVSTDLDGIYFVSDYCSGIFWGLVLDENDEWHFAELIETDLMIAGAGEGEDGELYVAACACQFGRDYDPYADPNGTVWRIVAADQVPEGAQTASMEEAVTEPEAEEVEVATDEANVVQVSLVEMSIVMPTELPAGPTTFEVTNDGDFGHNFEILGEGIEQVFDQDLDPGETRSMTVDLAPGNYTIICPVGTHAEEGMTLSLTVTEP
jgi:glucose/arabinose dehydrogenase